MNTEDLKELVVNAQRRRFEQIATRFAENPAVYRRRIELDQAADAYEFIRKMRNEDFEEYSFENQPIGKIDDMIDRAVLNARDEEDKEKVED